MPVYLDDRKLVKRLLAGDERAFKQFFDENFSRLYRFALARLSEDSELPREIVHVALAKALKKLATYRGEAALFTWLCVICRNEITDWVRRESRHRRHLVLTEDYPEIQAAVDSLDEPADEPGSRYQRYEVGRLIQVALDRLPARYGNALEWKYIEGYSVEEIAQRMQLSQQAAQSLLARARLAFKDIYSTLTRPVLDQQALEGHALKQQAHTTTS